MQRNELIDCLSKMKVVWTSSLMPPDYERYSNVLFNIAHKFSHLKQSYESNIVFIYVSLYMFPNESTQDPLRLTIHSDECDTEQLAIESLADNIIKLRQCLTDYAMDKLYGSIKYRSLQ